MVKLNLRVQFSLLQMNIGNSVVENFTSDPAESDNIER